MNGKRQILAGLEEIELLLEKQRVCAQIDVLLAPDQTLDDFVDLRMHQRFAAGDGNHRRAALVHSLETLFGAEFRLQDVRRILDLAATRTGQIAAEQRLQHQYKRIPLASLKLLL